MSIEKMNEKVISEAQRFIKWLVPYRVTVTEDNRKGKET